MKIAFTILVLIASAAAQVSPQQQEYQAWEEKKAQLISGSSGSGGAVWGTDAIGAAPTQPPVWVAGSDGTLIRSLTTDTNGYLKVMLQNGSLAVTGTFWQSTQPVSIASMPSTPVTGTFWQTTQPVSFSGQSVTVNTISGFALETGGNLASIKTNTDKIPALGQALANASVPVVLTAAQLTTLTPPAAITNFANETGGNLAAIKTNTDKIPALGQALAAASVPIVLTAAQLTTLTPPAAITNFANETGGNLAAIKTDADKIPALGQALAAASVPVVLTAAQMTTLTPVSAVTATLAAETTKVIGTVNISASQTVGIAAGSAVMGHVIADSGSTTAVTGNVASTVADGANVVLGAKADAKSTATDTTAVSAMQVLKEISAMEQAPASRAVTNAGTFAVQATLAAGSAVVGHVIADSGSTTTVTQATGTNLHVVVDSAPSTAVTNAGTFATQATLAAETTKVIGTVNIASGQTVGLAAGSQVIGHVINDANASVVIGKVAVDQTTPGTTNAVEITGSTDSSIGLTSTSKGAVTTSVNVKSSAGNVYGIFFLNGAVAGCWLELINSTTAGTLGTAVIINIPMASAGVQYLLFNPPIGGFTSGIAVGSASAVGGASACGTAATGVTVIYK